MLSAAYQESVRKESDRLSQISKRESRSQNTIGGPYLGYDTDLGRHVVGSAGGGVIYADYQGNALLRKGETVAVAIPSNTTSPLIQKINNL